MKKYFLSVLALVTCHLSLVTSSALAQATINISSNIPGTTLGNGNPVSPSGFISNFYQYALIIGGVLAFGAIVYGGILHGVSGGNPARQTEGRQWVRSALWGLLLLAGAYVILYTVNPSLVNLGLPGLTPLK